jgi:hypothetical protein
MCNIVYIYFFFYKYYRGHYKVNLLNLKVKKYTQSFIGVVITHELAHPPIGVISKRAAIFDKKLCIIYFFGKTKVVINHGVIYFIIFT